MAVTVDADLRADLEEAVRHLASFERPSASDGERRAAEWIAGRLRDHGCQARIEEERAHGTYWWPMGLLCALAGAAALTGRRARALGAGAFAAAAIADDITGGRQWFRRLMLPSRPTWNVVAVAGDADAQRTAVVVAHHDAAHTSLLFSPAPSAFVGERFPALLERTDTTPPLMWPVIGGPLLVAAGALLGARGVRTAGAVLALGAAASFAEIGLRGVVPGANDNLSGVATLIGLARRLADQPVDGLRVLLVSTGSEESFMEGMQAFGRRHFASLPADRTHVICVDTVGSPELVMLEGEGMLWMNDYPKGFKDFVAECARRAGLHLRRGLRFRNATDALIALRAGYPTVMLGSVNRYKLPDNYHWRTDVPDNVDFATTSDAVALCDEVIRKLAVRRVDFATHRN
jgi:peptidase M28-like protein